MTAEEGSVPQVTLPPLVFEPRDPGDEQAREASGRFEPGVADWVYLPIEVPPGVSQLAVAYGYDDAAPPAGERGNALDIGIFDERGIDVGHRAGFRGWSGGARRHFTISADAATPGYLPGPIAAGTWHVLLGPYTVAPGGLRWRVGVRLTFGPSGPSRRPAHPPTSVPGRGVGWYRGDLHLHTVHSDGRRLPAEAVTAARARGLDFINSSEHNTSSAHAVWGTCADPELLILTGEEPSTRDGHLVVAGLPAGAWIDWRYRAPDGVLPRVLDEVHRAGALAVVGHPFAGCLGCSWRFGYDGFDAVEVWNGPWTPDDEAAVSAWDGMLRRAAQRPDGGWLPAVGGSDAHREPDRIGLPQTVVFADLLSRDALLAALRRGRAWIAESASVDLELRARAPAQEPEHGQAQASPAAEVGIGERLRVTRDALVEVRLDVRGVAGGEVRLLTDDGLVVSAALPANGAGSVTWRTRARTSAYVRAEIRHPSGAGRQEMAALTNPIFLGAP